MSTNSTNVTQVTAQLAAPFRGKDLEWRIQRAGVNRNGEPFAIVVPYVTARAIMDRLDQVVGPANWQTDLKPSGPMGKKAESGMIGGIGIKMPVNDVQDNPEWVWKWDAAQASDIEPVKGSASGAIKRAAVHWGMGRDLYGVGDLFAKVWVVRSEAPKGAHYAKPNVKVKGETKQIEFWWLPPELPGEAPQATSRPAPVPAPPAPSPAAKPAEEVKPAEREGVQDMVVAADRATKRHGGPTKQQATYFVRLFHSSVFTPDERTKAASWLAEKSTQENIGDQIDWAKRTLDKRKGGKKNAAA